MVRLHTRNNWKPIDGFKQVGNLVCYRLLLENKLDKDRSWNRKTSLASSFPRQKMLVVWISIEAICMEK